MTSTTAETPGRCYYCGAYHEGVCARVASIEYHPDGTVRKVTFHNDAPVTRLNVDGIFSHPPVRISE